MKKQFTLFIIAVLAIMGINAQAQTNLLAGWNANGKTGSATEANKWGWASTYTGAAWGGANSTGFGEVKLLDVTTGHTNKDGTTFTGRIFMYRWDASYWGGILSLGKGDGTTTKATGITLTAGTSYTLSGLCEWYSNGSLPTYSFSFSDVPYLGNIIASKSFTIPSSTQKKLYPFTYTFTCAATGTYYLQIKQVNGTSSSQGTLMGLANLSLTESAMPPQDPTPAPVQTGYSVPVYGTVATGQPANSLINALDGSLSTYYSSKTGASSLPDTLDFYFTNTERLDSLVYYPYGAGFGSTSIYYSTTSKPDEFIKLFDYDFGMKTTRASVALNGANGVLNLAIVRMVVNSAKNGVATCAQMEFVSMVKPVPFLPGANSCTALYNKIDLPADAKQSISGATASSFEPGYDISKTYDGNKASFFITKLYANPLPVTLDYNFTNVDRIDYLVYTPRSGTNPVGNFQETEIWYATADAPGTFIKLCDYNFNAPATALKFTLPQSVYNPATIRIVVKSAYLGSAGVTCAEMAFYKLGISTADLYPSIFKDEILSELKPEVTQANIDAMSAGFFKDLAQCMYNKTYETSYRVQKYEPYQLLSTLQSELKVGGYSPFENPTGIYFAANDTAVIFVGETYGESISLLTRSYPNVYKSYQLNKGVNIIPLTANGLGYINYYTANYKQRPPVTIHIVSGKVNGCYDVMRTTANEWRNMLSNVVTDMIDVKGKYIGMIFPVSEMKKYNAMDAKPIIQLYDTLVKLQWEQMGLYKYNRVPKNHMFGEIDNGTWSWYAGENGAHWSGGTESTCDPIYASTYMWGLAHELGHVNQIRPGLKWGGTTEVTNNIYSALSAYKLYPRNSYLEARLVGDGYYNSEETGTGSATQNSMYGGRYNSFLNNALLKKQVWLYQYGTDSSTKPDWSLTGGDFFVRLTPLWQLVMYYQMVHPEKQDWFKDLAEKARTTDDSALTPGQLQLNFIKNTCDAVQEDLTDFFTKVGMLRVVDRVMNDYSTYQMTITAEDSVATVNYIKSKNYPKPESPLIYYLSKNSIDAYKNKAAVVGGEVGSGCAFTNISDELGGYKNYVTVDHSIWKNVAVFETYQGTELKRISMVGSGYLDNEKTRVYYPTGATSIYAVGWDGSRTLVYSGTPAGIAARMELPLTFNLNQVDNKIQICGLTETATLSLYDITGKQLLNKTITSKECVIVDFLQKGAYVVRVTTPNGYKCGKIIKR